MRYIITLLLTLSLSLAYATGDIGKTLEELRLEHPNILHANNDIWVYSDELSNTIVYLDVNGLVYMSDVISLDFIPKQAMVQALDNAYGYYKSLRWLNQDKTVLMTLHWDDSVQRWVLTYNINKLKPYNH